MKKVEKEMLEFWNPGNLDKLKEKIVDPKVWDLEIPIHLGYLFPDGLPVEGKDILEIGCGIGRLMKPLAEAGCRSIVGLDISEEMVKESETYLEGLKNAKVLLQPLTYEFPLNSESKDGIYSIMVFQHIHDRAIIKKYLKESFRVLRPKGQIRIQTHKGIPSVDGKFHGFQGQMYETLEEFVQEFVEAGFHVFSSEEGLGFEHWLWVTAEKP